MAQPVNLLGIDLGTTFSAIATLDVDGRPRTLANAEGDLLTPSVVFLDQDTWIVGREAEKAAAQAPDRFASLVKRDMGETQYSRPLGGQLYPPEVLQSLILEKLKRDAERVLGPVGPAVITVPAFFNESRRQKTCDAGQLAGLEVLDIINEPTAAAILYGTQTGLLNAAGIAERRERILVYDLGGGTFDVTLMELHGDDYHVLATDGDVQLGGADWNRSLADYVAGEAKRAFRGRDPRDQPRSGLRLTRAVEEAKRTLSVRKEATIHLEQGDEDWSLRITRDQFEELTAPLMERTRGTTREVLRAAGCEWSDVTRILLVGGSSRMPAVERMLHEESGLAVDRSLSPDEAVAQGAALYAGFRSRRGAGGRTIQVQNVNSHSVGLRARDPVSRTYRNAIIIPKNTPLPVSKARKFATAADNQRRLTIDVLEGEATQPEYCYLLGSCVIDPLPPGLPQKTLVEIEFNQGDNGRLVVRWTIAARQASGEATLDRPAQLSPAALEAWRDKRHPPG